MARKSKSEYWSPMNRFKRYQAAFERDAKLDLDLAIGSDDVTPAYLIYALLTHGYSDQELADRHGLPLETVHAAMDWFLREMVEHRADHFRATYSDHMGRVSGLRALGLI